MLEGPRGLHFEELEGAFPSVGGYAATLHLKVPKTVLEHFTPSVRRALLKRDANR